MMSGTLQLRTAEEASQPTPLHYDLTERVCSLLTCEVTLKALRASSRELRTLAQNRVRILRPKAGQRSGGCVDLTVISERFPYVETLDLRGVAGLVRDDTCAATPRLHKLHTLVLDGCRHVTDDGLAKLSTSVQTLSLRHCSQVTWGGLRNLGQLSNLSTLNITGIKLQGAMGAPAVGAVPQPQPQPGGEPADAAAAVPAVGGHQPGAGAAMGGPGAAQGAAVAPGSFTPDAALCKVLQQLDSLTLGDPMSLSFIADRLVVEGLAAARPLRLSHLDLSGCIDLTDWAVHELCGAMPSLTSLSLQSCVRLTNAALLELPRLPGLRQLNLRGCLQLSDAGLAAGLSGLAALEVLNLQGCTAVTGSCLVELAPCKALADLNVSHCAAFSSLEPLRALGGLRRLAVSHCAKLCVAGITALTALSGLTEVRASHLRNLAAPGAGGGPAAGALLSTEQLAAMSSLLQLQALDLSYFSHPGGFPGGLLDAVAALTRLTRLCLAGCGGLAADAPAGLGFLSGLRRLEELDLGAWQEVDPQQLTCLAGATALRRLVISRLGNRHANGCFDGCDCNGSPSSSLAPSLSSSAESSPDRSEAGAGVAGTSLAPAAAAAAAAERRAAAAAASRAAAAALAAAASMVAEAAVAAAASEEATGAEAGRETSSGGASTTSSDDSSRSSTGGSSELSGSCRAARRRSRPHPAGSGLQHASSWAVETQAEADAAAAAAAAADATMDALARQMAAVGISCRCGRGCGAAIGSEGTSASSSSSTGTSSMIAAACAAAAAAARAAAAEAELAATSAAAVAAGARRRHGTPAGDDVDGTDQSAPAGAANAGTAVDAVAHIDSVSGAPVDAASGAAAANRLIDDSGLNRALAKVPPVHAPRPFLNLGGDGPSPATGAVLVEAGLPPLAVPLTPRPGLDGALGHLTSLTALTEIHLEACNHVTDAGVARLARLPRLELLDLGGCNRVTGRTLAAFARAGHGALHTLTLANCVSLTDAGVVALAGVGGLRVVDLAGCSRVTDAGGVALGGLRRLTRLSLRGLAKITDRTVEVLAELPALQSLTLSLCGAISDNALAHLAGQAPVTHASSNSHSADDSSSSVTAASVPAVGAAAARALTWLDVSHCWRLSAGGVRKLEAARPQLKVIFTGRR